MPNSPGFFFKEANLLYNALMAVLYKKKYIFIAWYNESRRCIKPIFARSRPILKLEFYMVSVKYMLFREYFISRADKL